MRYWLLLISNEKLKVLLTQFEKHSKGFRANDDDIHKLCFDVF